MRGHTVGINSFISPVIVTVGHSFDLGGWVVHALHVTHLLCQSSFHLSNFIVCEHAVKEIHLINFFVMFCFHLLAQ